MLDHLFGGGLPPPHPPPPLDPPNFALKVAKDLKSHYSHFVHLKAHYTEILQSVVQKRWAWSLPQSCETDFYEILAPCGVA